MPNAVIENGRVLLLWIIGIVIAHSIISLFIDPTLFSLVFEIIVIILLYLIYIGHTWAKVITAIYFLLNSIAVLIIMLNYPHMLDFPYPFSVGVISYLILSICIFVVTGLILLFSKDITEFMVHQRK